MLRGAEQDLAVSRFIREASRGNAQPSSTMEPGTRSSATTPRSNTLFTSEYSKLIEELKAVARLEGQ